MSRRRVLGLTSGLVALACFVALVTLTEAHAASEWARWGLRIGVAAGLVVMEATILIPWGTQARRPPTRIRQSEPGA